MLIATTTAVFRLAGDGAEDEPALRFEGKGVRRVAAGDRHDLIALDGGTLAIMTGAEQRRVETGIEEPVHCLLVLSEDPLRVLVGTEPPHVYEFGDDGRPASRSASFAALECRGKWHTPWGGPPAVRSMASTRDGWVYADIHVGSIMRSPDRGVTWAPVTPDLHEDVHQVATSPVVADRVYANTARAVYISDDRGRSWRHRADDLGSRYGRAIAVHPTDPDCILATVSDGPHGDNVHGQLFRTEDAGATWQAIGDGFPSSTVKNIDTFHVAFAADGTAWAVVGRTLYVGRNGGGDWAEFWDAPDRIVMLADG